MGLVRRRWSGRVDENSMSAKAGASSLKQDQTASMMAGVVVSSRLIPSWVSTPASGIGRTDVAGD